RGRRSLRDCRGAVSELVFNDSVFKNLTSMSETSLYAKSWVSNLYKSLHILTTYLKKKLGKLGE
ncbi:MAG: hypothetical protein QW369_06820, partial [Desulfurococcaceae archaeon]